MFHMHNEHKTGGKFNDFARALFLATVGFEVRWLMGDCNMRMYTLSRAFEHQAVDADAVDRLSQAECGNKIVKPSRTGVTLTLCAYHCELDLKVVGNGLELEPTRQVLFDSLGIWCTGYYTEIQSCPPEVHALQGMAWPYYFDGKKKTFGYPSQSYTNTGGQPPPVGADTAIMSRYERLGAVLELKRTVSVMDRGERIDTNLITEDGMKLVEDLKHTWGWNYKHRPRVSGPDKQWGDLGKIKEMLATPASSDPYGQFHGKNAHMSLIVTCFPSDSLKPITYHGETRHLINRQRSDAAEKQRRIKFQKRNYLQKRMGLAMGY